MNMLNPPSQTLRLLIRLYTAFFISGLIHYLADVSILQPHLPGQQPGAMTFFLLQALAITFEMLLGYVVRSLEGATGVKVPVILTRAVGYVWVICWLTATHRIWTEPVIRAGFMEDGWHSPLVLSISEWIKKRAGEWLKFE